MCGIFGLATDPGAGAPDRRLLERSARLLAHRGPDSEGFYADDGVGLTQTRLALLDLSERSSQPFWDATGRSCIVYNGEVYNFTELRAELEAEGRSFRTTSDTEVVLEAIIAWGLARALASLEGMFALAFWDGDNQKLSLARDRFGIKPLFIIDEGDRILFSSEVQAFEPWTELRPDLRTMAAYLYATGGPTKGRTFFEGVHQLEPGTFLTLTPGKAGSPSRFASVLDYPSPERQSEMTGLSDLELVDRTEELLVESVNRQLVADAPVGVLCSGGVDSSLIIAIAARSHDSLGAFHANVAGPTSELSPARDLASHLGLDLQVVDVRDKDFLDLLPALTAHHGSPFHLNPHSVPFFRVSQLIRDSGYKAVLSGEGADESYLGYPWLPPGRTRSRSNNHAADPSRTFLAPVEVAGGDAPATGGGSGHSRQVDLLSGMLGGFSTESEHVANAEALSHLTAAEHERALQTLDLMNSNLRGLLHRNDAMGMAASIESRFPFLDETLIEDAVNMPARAKVRRSLNPRERQHPLSISKWVLRKVADRYLPKSLSRRPKVPFATTAYNRMAVAADLFRDGYVASEFGLGREELGYLMDRADRRLTSKLVHLETWGRVFIAAESIDQIVDDLHRHVSIRPN